MTDEQIQAVLCAWLDLRGALEAYEALDLNAHDWKAHQLSVAELEEAFDFLRKEKELEK